MKKIFLLVCACLLFAAPVLAQNEAGAKEVARATFTTGVENREPIDSMMEYTPVGGASIFCFTELRNMEGSRIAHVWSKNGEELYTLVFDVHGPRWRVNSSMKAEHFKPGDDVLVQVTDEEGAVLESIALHIR